MSMNYHELTMNEPRDSPERRKQLLVICFVMAVCFVHSFLSAGGLTPVNIDENGIFPGGDYVYKYSLRDYAASASLAESITRDIRKVKKPSRRVDVENHMYSIYLDDPRYMGGFQQRFAVGYLATDPESRNVKKELLKKKAAVAEPTLAEIRKQRIPVRELWPLLHYRTVSLPSVNSAVVQFPSTHGFVSALILSWKILPALRKYANEHAVKGSPVVVVSTCSTVDNMCTHYAPLYKGKTFLLGQVDSETWRNQRKPEPWLDTKGIVSLLKKMFPFVKHLGV